MTKTGKNTENLIWQTEQKGAKKNFRKKKRFSTRFLGLISYLAETFAKIGRNPELNAKVSTLKVKAYPMIPKS